MPRIELIEVEGLYAVARLEPGAAVPAWALAPGGLASVTRTEDELSIVCLAERVPSEAKAERDWRCLRVKGTLDFALVGILAALTRPLAEAGISLFALSTFDTDYLLVRSADLARALAALEAAGHSVQRVAVTGAAGTRR